MKILDKLKNALFEEEYVEVEEKKDKKEKPIAKKIILPESRRERREEAVFEEDEVKEELPKEEKKTFKFPAISEDDFVDMREKPAPRVEERPKPVERREAVQDFHPAYPPRPVEKKTEKVPYGNKKEEIKIESYGTYEKKETKRTFHPSPVISPIYGLIDSGVPKEEVTTKKEVRLTSSYSSRKLDVDSVRAKAYGGNDDIFDEELTSSSNEKKVEDYLDDKRKYKEISEEEEDTNSMLEDITDNTPAVPKVTVGDAEEYFEDLGLEYNVDYKDISHERKTGRRRDLRHKEDTEPELEDNLFDLFDSMYDDTKEN